LIDHTQCNALLSHDTTLLCAGIGSNVFGTNALKVLIVNGNARPFSTNNISFGYADGNFSWKRSHIGYGRLCTNGQWA